MEIKNIYNETRIGINVYNPWNSPGQIIGVGSRSLFQGFFPIQRSNPGLPHCRQILYQLSHKGSPKCIYKYAKSVKQGRKIKMYLLD